MTDLAIATLLRRVCPDRHWEHNITKGGIDAFLAQLEQDIEDRNNSNYPFEDPYHFLQPGFFDDLDLSDVSNDVRANSESEAGASETSFEASIEDDKNAPLQESSAETCPLQKTISKDSLSSKDIKNTNAPDDSFRLDEEGHGHETRGVRQSLSHYSKKLDLQHSVKVENDADGGATEHMSVDRHFYIQARKSAGEGESSEYELHMDQRGESSMSHINDDDSEYFSCSDNENSTCQTTLPGGVHTDLPCSDVDEDVSELASRMDESLIMNSAGDLEESANGSFNTLDAQHINPTSPSRLHAHVSAAVENSWCDDEMETLIPKGTKMYRTPSRLQHDSQEDSNYGHVTVRKKRGRRDPSNEPSDMFPAITPVSHAPYSRQFVLETREDLPVSPSGSSTEPSFRRMSFQVIDETFLDISPIATAPNFSTRVDNQCGSPGYEHGNQSLSFERQFEQLGIADDKASGGLKNDPFGNSQTSPDPTLSNPLSDAKLRGSAISVSLSDINLQAKPKSPSSSRLTVDLTGEEIDSHHENPILTGDDQGSFDPQNSPESPPSAKRSLFLTSKNVTSMSEEGWIQSTNAPAFTSLVNRELAVTPTEIKDGPVHVVVDEVTEPGPLLPVPSSPVEQNDEWEEESDDDSDRGLLVFEGTPTKPVPISVWEPSHTQTPARKPLSAFNTPSTPSIIAFARKRVMLANALYAEFNEKVFGSKLPADLEISWSRKLNTTAGRCFQERTFSKGAFTYTARIELSVKVIDNVQKLRITLAHEMCHAAQWVINHTNKPAHGPIFKYWGQVVESVYPDIQTRACHSYEIAYKFTYICKRCEARYGRHSKSINTATHGCGGCRGPLILLGHDAEAANGGVGRLKKDGTPCKVNRYTVFMRENFARIKAENPDLQQRELMILVGKLFRADMNSASS
ncbi:SprT-like family-domain-containing protein [Powellomyces hirtus]|nr:SprT-like family-domain-containing protein [Powellomyces hirtus]